MGALADIFRAFGPAYLARFPNLPVAHRRVVEAIVQCRSGLYGSMVYRCSDCGATHWVGRACGNRHCPQCQAHKTRQWLDRQLGRRVAGPHFLLTFTVPEALRSFLRSRPRVGYTALFHSSASAMKTLARDPRHVGADLIGFTGVLHTWGRQLQFHPHVHVIVPGGGLSTGRDRWLPSRTTFFLPVRALSRIFRAQFKDRMKRVGLLEAIDPQVWRADWNVHCEPVGDGEHAFRYLASYVFRVALSDRRIAAFSKADHTVSFHYKDQQSEKESTITLDAFEFLRRFLQHVLPAGFMKVRHFGFLHPNCAVPLDEVRRLIAEATGQELLQPRPEEDRPVLYCPDCGGSLVYLHSVPVPLRPPFLDTG